MAKSFDQVWLWDLGPPVPVEPMEPPLPAGFESDPEFIRAREMVRFRYTLAAYDLAYRAYLDDKKEFAAFGGRAKHIAMPHVEANEAISRDPRRYTKVLP